MKGETECVEAARKGRFPFAIAESDNLQAHAVDAAAAALLLIAIGLKVYFSRTAPHEEQRRPRDH